ncbi:MAG: thioesterase domain-containing protein [Candidatus Omnitrophota bacterium]
MKRNNAALRNESFDLLWMKSFSPNPSAKMRLFCFPYAGGGCAAFRTWAGDAPREMQICPVQLPGREYRIMETPFSNLPDLIPVLAQALRPYFDRPFAIFGHSLGALIAFELVRELRRAGEREPLRLFVSARRAPHIPPRKSPIHNLPHDEFMKELRRFKGTPDEVLNNAELMELVLPALRADFRMHETYTYKHELPLTMPINIFGGLDDAEVRREELEGWSVQTSASTELKLFPGDHFFLHREQKALIEAIAHNLNGMLA